MRSTVKRASFVTHVYQFQMKLSVMRLQEDGAGAKSKQIWTIPSQ